MMSLQKTMAKFRPLQNQTKYISSKNVLFIEFEPLCQKLWAFLSNLGSFYDACSPNMVMSHDPRCKFQKLFNFVLILYLILGKVTKFPVEKLSTSKVISKNLTGMVYGG